MTFKIVSDSHVDHGLSPEQLSFVQEATAMLDGFYIRTVELPEYLGKVPCELHGPLMGDQPVEEAEVRYAPRGTRSYPSRLCERGPRFVRTVTVIAGPFGDHERVLYTAFGGPMAPKEPGDPGLSEEERPAAEAFWAEHAL